MAGTNQVVQARQWSSPAYPLLGGSAQHCPADISFRDLLPSFGRAWHEERYGGGRSHAQKADLLCLSHLNGREGRSRKRGRASREVAGPRSPPPHDPPPPKFKGQGPPAFPERQERF